MKYRYRREWYFRWPDPLFRLMERSFAWHLCLTADAL